MNAQQLKNAILQEAIEGRLVPQDPNDEPASVLLDRIRKEKAQLLKEGKFKKKDIGKTPIAEDEKPFEIPESWEWRKLNDVCAITNGFTPLRTEPLFWDKGTINWFTVEDIKQQGEIINYTKQKITEAATAKERVVRAGSVLLCCTASIGKCALTKIPITTNQQFNALTVKPEYIAALSDEYLFLFAKTLEDELHRLAGKTTFEFVSVKKVGNIAISIPPLAEQQRIVARIEELLPKVEEYGKAQEALDKLNAELPERLKKSILQEAIEGRLVPQDPNDEPASALLDRIRKEKAQLVKAGKLKKKDLEETPITEEEKPFEIPEGWEWCHLGEIVDMQMGKTPPRGEPLHWQNGKESWVSISDMKDYGHIQTTKEKISEYSVKKVFKKKSPKGTLLMSFKLTIGRTSILDIPAFHNEAIISIYPYVDTNNSFRNYLFYLLPLLSILGDSKDAIKGKTLNSTSLNNLLIPLPPLAEQQRIVAKIEELLGAINALP